jgi:hypothetical protein
VQIFTVVFLLAPPERVGEAEGAVGPERQGGDPGVVPAARRADIVAAAEVEGHGGGRDRVRLVVDPAMVRVVVAGHVDDAGAGGRVHGDVRRQRETQPAASTARDAGPAHAVAAVGHRAERMGARAHEHDWG